MYVNDTFGDYQFRQATMLYSDLIRQVSLQLANISLEHLAMQFFFIEKKVQGFCVIKVYYVIVVAWAGVICLI